jgi:hypothetical protein
LPYRPTEEQAAKQVLQRGARAGARGFEAERAGRTALADPLLEKTLARGERAALEGIPGVEQSNLDIRRLSALRLALEDALTRGPQTSNVLAPRLGPVQMPILPAFLRLNVDLPRGLTSGLGQFLLNPAVAEATRQLPRGFGSLVE